jgi:SAM-dependent methyltransferase
MKWQVRFLRNALFGLLPLHAQEQLRMAKRRLLPYDPQIDEWTLEQGIRQVEMLKNAGCCPAGKDCLELGTGWQPIIPLVFYVAGCRKLTLVDSQKLLDKKSLIKTSIGLAKYKEKISDRLEMSPKEVEEKLDRPINLSFNSLLESYNFNYLAPTDIVSNNLPDQSFDIIISRAVLEHVPPVVIKGMFSEFKRLLRPNGKMCHIIDNSDHWEHKDKSLSRLSFLKYSEKTFKFFTSWNPLDYQNRLRHFQYKSMMEDTGFKVVIDDSPVNEKALEDLKTIKIDSSFKGIPHRELAILTSYLVASV